jgi:hypothetical protein
MANVLATFAQFERGLIGQRTRDALAVKKAQGGARAPEGDTARGRGTDSGAPSLGASSRRNRATSQRGRSCQSARLGLLGRFDEARSILAEVQAEAADRGARLTLATTLARDSADVELLAGDPVAAVDFGEEGCRLLHELGDKAVLSTMAGKLAQSYYALDRLEEADAWAGRAVELGASDDAITQMLWRSSARATSS